MIDELLGEPCLCTEGVFEESYTDFVLQGTHRYQLRSARCSACDEEVLDADSVRRLYALNDRLIGRVPRCRRRVP